MQMCDFQIKCEFSIQISNQTSLPMVDKSICIPVSILKNALQEKREQELRRQQANLEKLRLDTQPQYASQAAQE